MQMEYAAHASIGPEVEPKMALSAVSLLWRPDCACWVWEFRIPSRPWIDVARSRGEVQAKISNAARAVQCSGETPDAARMLGGCECEWLWLWIFHQRCWPFAVEWLSASSVFKVQDYYVVFDIEYHQKVVRLSTGQASRQPHYGESSDDWERVRRGIHGLD
jgi:hypothetical protein